MWGDAHSDITDCGDTDLPLKKGKPLCLSFCRARCLSGQSADSQLVFSSTRNLMLNICRSLQPLYKKITKQISPSTRHPVLLVQSVCKETGAVLACNGWVLSLAGFRPLRVDGIELELPDLGALVPPCDVRLKSANIFKSVLSTFCFASMDRIAFDIAQSHTAYVGPSGTGRLEYCFQPQYTLAWGQLTSLHLANQLTWTPVCLVGHDNDDDGDDNEGDQDDANEDQDGPNDELEDLTNLVDELLGEQKTESKQQSKRRSKQQSTRGRAGGGHKSEKPAPPKSVSAEDSKIHGR